MTYLVAKEAADYTRMTVRSIHEKTSQKKIPFRKLAGSRRLLFTTGELDAWLAGADLETIEKRDGSVIVRPRSVDALAEAWSS